MDNCPKCKQPMEMYYEPWCPRCDKPQRKTVQMLNLIQCLEHIEATNHRPGYKRRVWSLMVEYVNNDTIIPWIYLGEYLDEYDLTPMLREDIDLFNDTFDIKPNDEIYMEISW